MPVFQVIINSLRKAINLHDSHFYDIARADELSRNITNGKAEYPAILVVEADMYSPTTNQDGIDLKNEIRTGSDFFIRIFSQDIDDMINVEEAIKSHFASPQKLSFTYNEDHVKTVTILFNADEKINRKNMDNGIFYSTLSMKYTDMVLPKDVENPIKIELDKNTQLKVMKHLCLLDSTLSSIEKEMESALQGTDAYEKLENQHKDIEEQISSMYTFENLCAEKIVSADHGFVTCYVAMVKNKWNITQATEAYEQKHEQEKKAKEAEKARIDDINKRFTKKGDKILNRYTDAVVEDIRNRLQLDFPVNIYGGSTLVDFHRMNALRVLKFPNIAVFTESNYTFDNKSYTNITIDDFPITHNYSLDALPIVYGVIISILSQEEDQMLDISDKIKKLYEEEVQIKVPDAVIKGEFCPIKMAIDRDITETINTTAYGTIYRTLIVFKRFPCIIE